MWYRTRRRTGDRTRPDWPEAPPILEEIHDMQDALAFGGAWRQIIFWPFQQMSNHGRGTVLRARVESDAYAAEYYDPRSASDPAIPLPHMPYLKHGIEIETMPNGGAQVTAEVPPAS